MPLTQAVPVPTPDIRPDMPVESAREQRALRARGDALLAYRLASARLTRSRQDSRIQRSLVTGVGLVGLLGWPFVFAFRNSSFEVLAAIGVVSAILQSVPIIVAGLSALRTRSLGEEIATTVEGARMLASQAEDLAGLYERLRMAADKPGRSELWADDLLIGLERSAATARESEKHLSGMEPTKTRRHPRIKPTHNRVIITVSNDRKLRAAIIDVSISGVAIEGNLPGITVGMQVLVGSHKAKAVRALPSGMAFEFLIPIQPDLLTPDIIL